MNTENVRNMLIQCEQQSHLIEQGNGENYLDEQQVLELLSKTREEVEDIFKEFGYDLYLKN